MKTTFHTTHTVKKARTPDQERASVYLKRIANTAKKASYKTPEATLSLLADTTYQNAITQKLKRFRGTKEVVLIGIGGSSLGTEAIYNALKTAKSPRLTVVDSLEEDAIESIERIFASATSPKECVIVVVSKSGKTLETITNARLVLQRAQKRWGKDTHKQIICIGDAGSALESYARTEQFLFFEIPQSVGGRYSVFSAVGIVPLQLLRIDTSALLAGAKAVLQSKQLTEIAVTASILAYEARQGTTVFNFFVYHNRLRSVAYWYRQLLAESLGKDTTIHGEPFTLTILPTVATAIDLHSMAQLYMSGTRSILTRFVYATISPSKSIPSKGPGLDTSTLHKHSLNDVRQAIIQGVTSVYDEKKIPYLATELINITAQEVGFLLATLMCEVMTLAHLLEINAFDQPNVEQYKQYARAKMS